MLIGSGSLGVLKGLGHLALGVEWRFDVTLSGQLLLLV